MEYPEPKFVNKDGTLTAYSLACGYVQALEDGWELFQDGCYHLRRSSEEWLTFSSLTKARQTYKTIRRESK